MASIMPDTLRQSTCSPVFPSVFPLKNTKLVAYVYMFPLFPLFL
jgi:hypothetical protein